MMDPRVLINALQIDALKIVAGVLTPTDAASLSRVSSRLGSVHPERQLEAHAQGPQRDPISKLMYAQLLHEFSNASTVCSLIGCSIQQLAGEFEGSLVAGLQAAVRYHGRKGESNRLSLASAEGFTLTSRCLLLDRFARLPGKRNSLQIMWSGLAGPDNYLSCLGLSHEVLTGWRGRRVLDIACGGSPFHAEANVCYGIDVVALDFNPQTDAAQEIICGYAKNMLFLNMLRVTGLMGKCGIADLDDSLLSTLLRHLPAITRHYLENPIRKGDVFKLGDMKVDVCLSSWLFSYFDRKEQIEALAEMGLATRIGGEIRICPGLQGDVDRESAEISADVVQGANDRLNERGKKLEALPREEYFFTYRVRQADQNCVMQ